MSWQVPVGTAPVAVHGFSLDDGSNEFVSLFGMVAFFDATTERIFEESGKGILASL